VRDLKTDMRIEHEISDSELLYTTDVEVVAANAVEQCLVQLTTRPTALAVVAAGLPGRPARTPE
jgi:hypothetical protein